MIIATVIISIFVISGTAALINKILPFRICPICAGVAGTWLWIFGGMFVGVLPASNFQLPTAILMGGSVVGIAYQIERRLFAGRSEILFKLFFIPVGFIAVYGLLLSRYALAGSAIAILAMIALLFLKTRIGKEPDKDKRIKEIEKQMENCC